MSKNLAYQKVLNTLGLARRAHKLITGQALIYAIQKQKVNLIVMCNDIGQAQRKKILDKAKYYNIKVLMDLFSSNLLQHATQLKYIKVVGVYDNNMVKLIEKSYIDDNIHNTND